MTWTIALIHTLGLAALAFGVLGTVFGRWAGRTAALPCLWVPSTSPRGRVSGQVGPSAAATQWNCAVSVVSPIAVVALLPSLTAIETASK